MGKSEQFFINSNNSDGGSSNNNGLHSSLCTEKLLVLSALVFTRTASGKCELIGFPGIHPMPWDSTQV